jgi:Protein of unknown function (DUF1194)
MWRHGHDGCAAMMIAMGAAAAWLVALTVATSAAFGAEQADLALVLAADVSRSVDAAKFHLQREGYVQAMTDPRVIEAIKSGPHGRIAVCFIEWSGVASQKLVMDWSLIADAESARQFSDGIIEAPRSFADRTAISAGIDFAVAQLARAPYAATRRIIDISGDGTNNSGRDVTAARDEAVAKGLTINGLAILSDAPLIWNPEHTNPPGGLPEYYRHNVVGGPSAFVMVAQDFASFGQSLIKKLIAEIATALPSRQGILMPAVARP